MEWIEGIKDVKLDDSLGDETERGVVFIDLPLITMLLDLSALKVRPAKFKAVVKRESKAFVPQTVETCLGHPSRLSFKIIRYYLDETVVW